MGLPRLLVIERDALLLRTYSRIFGKEFTVTCASDASAISQLATFAGALSFPSSFDAALWDVSLGQGTEAIAVAHPELVGRVVLSASAPTLAASALAARMDARLIMKTMPPAELRSLLQTVAGSQAMTPRAPVAELPIGFDSGARVGRRLPRLRRHARFTSLSEA